jgi:hypothetical protein
VGQAVHANMIVFVELREYLENQFNLGRTDSRIRNLVNNEDRGLEVDGVVEKFQQAEQDDEVNNLLFPA